MPFLCHERCAVFFKFIKRMKQVQQRENDYPKTIIEFGVQALTKYYYNRRQFKILFRIFMHQQADFIEARRQNAYHGQLTLSPEVAEKHCKVVDIPLSYLEPDSHHRKDLVSNLQAMSKKVVKIPCTCYDAQKKQTLTRYRTFNHLFTAQVAQRADGTRVARLTVEAQLLEYYMCSRDWGYHKLDVEAVMSMHHLASIRMYQLLSTYHSRRGCHFSPQLLRQQLSEGDKCYSSFASVDRQLLQTARCEMDSLYGEGVGHLHFTYEAVYGKEDSPATGRHDRWPRLVKMTVKRREDEATEGEVAEADAKERAMFSITLQQDYRVSPRVAQALAARVKHGEMPCVLQKMAEVASVIRQKALRGCGVKKAGGYMVKALDAYLQELGM